MSRTLRISRGTEFLGRSNGTSITIVGTKLASLDCPLACRQGAFCDFKD
jgi:hypothetical protein